MTKHIILFLAANPDGLDKSSLEREAHAIHAELERSGYRDHFEFVTRWALQPLDLLREVRKHKPTVVHFCGRGSGDATGAPALHPPAAHSAVDHELHDGEQQPGLSFLGPDGNAQSVSIAAIAETFGAAGSSVRLVVLNACYTPTQADALLAHVDCVVGTTREIRDASARNFAIGFYGGVAEGEPVAAAFHQGRAAIRLEDHGAAGRRHASRRAATVPGHGAPSPSDADRATLSVRAGLDAGQLVLATTRTAGAFHDQRLLDILRQLTPMIAPHEEARPNLFREIVEPAFEDLRGVHRDYVEMFRQMQKVIPERRDDDQYQAKVMAAAEQLRDMRMRGATVRVELRKLAEHLQRTQLSRHAREFADALLDYFPDGSLREPSQRRDAGWWKTASSALLDQIDEDLSEVQQHDLAGLIRDTIMALDIGWAEACDAYQSFRMAQFNPAT
jgi:hypothetical protein